MRIQVIIIAFLLSSFSFSQAISDTIIVSSNNAVTMKFDEGADKLTFFSPYNGSKLVVSKQGNSLYILKNKVISGSFGSTNLIVNSGEKVFIFIVVEETPSRTMKKFYFDYQTKPDKAEGKEIGIDLSERKQREAEEAKELAKRKEFEGKIKILESKPRNIFDISTIKYKYNAWVDKLYIDEKGNIFIEYAFKNNSNIDIEIDTRDFFVRGKHGILFKRSIEEEIKSPIYVHNDTKVVKAESTVKMVFVFETFVIESKKAFFIEIWEKKGDRKIINEINAKKIHDIQKL